MRRWEDAWQRWDAFLTFVVKQLGTEAQAIDLRQALADVLIDARFDLLQALAPTDRSVTDPTRALFLQTWERLAPVVRVAAAGVPAGDALRYLSFIAAGDALAALDEAGPDLGVEISADGLRRLARIVAPLSIEDPLLYTTEVDPQLRQLMGFGPPLPPPDLAEIPPDEASWRRWWVRAAFAAQEAPPASQLERWLASRDGIDAYLAAVRAVLDEVTVQTLGGGALAAQHHDLYRRLVLATAWQESCWRQFVRAKGGVKYLTSPVGSIGIMQVNERVWRGLYDVRGLRWDIRYNGRAGSEILLHYLADYAIAKKEDARPGGADNLAWATYAVYNGGPRHLTRYRNPATKKGLKRIDELFAQKYRAVTAGKESDVKQCLVGG